MSGLTEMLAGVRSADRTEPTAHAAPRVNLLPEGVIARRAVRRAQRGGVVAVGATVLVLAASWLIGGSHAASEQQELDTAQARVTALQAQQAQYAAAPQTVRALRSTEEARTTAMAEDVSWSAFVDSLSSALPAGAWLDGVQATLDPDDGATGAAAAPGEGSVTITARSTSYEDVAAYLDALGTVPGVSDAYLMTASLDAAQAQSVVSFTITARVTDAALSHRFAQADAAATDLTQEVG